MVKSQRIFVLKCMNFVCYYGILWKKYFLVLKAYLHPHDVIKLMNVDWIKFFSLCKKCTGFITVLNYHRMI